MVGYWADPAQNVDLSLFSPGGAELDRSYLTDVSIEQVVSRYAPLQGVWTLRVWNLTSPELPLVLASTFWFEGFPRHQTHLPLAMRGLSGAGGRSQAAAVRPLPTATAGSVPYPGPVPIPVLPLVPTAALLPTAYPPPPPTLAPPPTATPPPTRTPTRTPLPSPTPTPAPCGAAVFDDPAGSYGGGNWEVAADPQLAYGGSYHLAVGVGQNTPYVDWQTEATYLSVRYRTGPEYGDMIVYLNGAPVDQVSAAAATPGRRCQLEFRSPGSVGSAGNVAADRVGWVDGH